MTIIRAFTAASRIRGIAADGDLPETLRLMVEQLNSFLDSSHLGGMGRSASMDSGPSDYRVASRSTRRTLAVPLLQALKAAHPQMEIAPIQRLCRLKKAGMSFTAGSKSSCDSQISYRFEDGELRFGRILSILTDDADSQRPVNDRTLVVVERYRPLSVLDSTKDLYGAHPLIGRTGYDLCRIVYDVFASKVDVIRPSSLVGHIARCLLKHGDPLSFEFNAIVVVQLDRVCATFFTFASNCKLIVSCSLDLRRRFCGFCVRPAYGALRQESW